MAGVIGGLTSVITQPVKGAQNDGAVGFFKGLGKGIVGTVTKPVTGRWHGDCCMRGAATS